MKYRLEYQSNVESRVCIPCHQLLTKGISFILQMLILLIIYYDYFYLIWLGIAAESDTGSGDYTGFSNMSTSGINSPQVIFIVHIFYCTNYFSI